MTDLGHTVKKNVSIRSTWLLSSGHPRRAFYDTTYILAARLSARKSTSERLCVAVADAWNIFILHNDRRISFSLLTLAGQLLAPL